VLTKDIPLRHERFDPWRACVVMGDQPYLCGAMKNAGVPLCIGLMCAGTRLLVFFGLFAVGSSN